MFGDKNDRNSLIPLRRHGLFILLAFLLSLAGCHSRQQLTCQPPPDLSADGKTAETAGRPPARLISLVPSLTETACDLGLADKLAAITANDDYPPEILRLPKVGDMNPDYEYLIALQPDAILIDTSITNAQIQSRLKQLGLPVVETHIEYLGDLVRELPHLGEALNCRDSAGDLQQEIQNAMLKARQRAKALPRRPRVYIDVYNNPLLTAGKPSLLNELLEIAGGENIYADIDKPYPNISAEDLIVRRPDIVLLTSMSAEAVRKHPQLSKLDAVKEGNILEMPSSLMQRPTKRSLRSIEIMQNYFEDWAGKESDSQ